MSPRLDVQDLGVVIGGRSLLAGVSFGLEPGEVVALVGRSGSGKSLTARALIGLQPPGASVSGAVRLDGRDLLGLPERAWGAVRGTGVGLVFQEPAMALDPVMPIRAQVGEGLRVHGLARGRAADRDAQAWLQRLGLDPAVTPGGRRPHQLSGGQRQRAALAAVLALRPKVLVADEPTTALDPITAAQVIDLLAGFARETGAALLLISHDLAGVSRVADRLLVLDHGRITGAGRLLQALADPSPALRVLRDAARARPASPPRPASPAAPLLRAERLTRLYPGADGRQGGVRDVALVLHPGERLAVVGQTGAGKSTLLRLLLGLERPQAGEVRLAGQPFNPAPASRQQQLRQRIQPVFQDPAGSFDPRWTAQRIVAEPLGLLRPRLDAAQTRARVVETLQAVGLSASDLDRPARAFSGGQRQRLALARALSVRPEVIVLDEATSALDPIGRAEVLALLARLGEARGLACVAVTHDLALVRAFADRVIVLQSGRVVEAGATAQVLSAPQHDYTRALVAAAPDLDTVLAARRAAGSQA